MLQLFGALQSPLDSAIAERSDSCLSGVLPFSKGNRNVDIVEIETLIGRVRQGDEASAAELVRQYEPLIRREVRMRLEDSRLRRVLDSMDVVQSVMASFFVRTALGEYDLKNSADLIRLLISMTKNKVASVARFEKREKRDSRRTVIDEEVLVAVPNRDETPSQIVSGRELLERFKGLLSPEEKQLSELRVSGKTWDEIASVLGGTAQARRVQYSRVIHRVSLELGLIESGE